MIMRIFQVVIRRGKEAEFKEKLRAQLEQEKNK